jgi:hypothetical protein
MCTQYSHTLFPLSFSPTLHLPQAQNYSVNATTIFNVSRRLCMIRNILKPIVPEEMSASRIVESELFFQNNDQLVGMVSLLQRFGTSLHIME